MHTLFHQSVENVRHLEVKIYCRYVLVSNSEVKARKEQSDQEMIIWNFPFHGLVTTAFTGYWGSQKLKAADVKLNCFWSWCSGEAGGGFHICGADVILGWPLALVHFTNLTMIKGCEPFGGQLLLLPRHPIKVPRTPTLHFRLHTLQDSSELEEYRLTSKSFQLHQYYWPL